MVDVYIIIYIYICSRKSGPKKNQSFWCEHNKCGDMLMYNDTMIHGAVGRFRSRRSQPKLISWWRIFVVKLMVPVCSGISQIGQRTHTHTDTVGIHTNTHPKKHKTGINNDQQWSTFTTTCYSCSLYLLVSPRTLYGRSVWIGLSWSLKANCAEQSLPLLTLLPLSTSTILSQVESISSWTLGILLCQRTMAFWIAYLQKWSKMQILWNGNCRESTVEKAIESAILRSSWNNFLSHSSLSPRESTN